MIEMQKGIFRSVTGQKLDRRLWLPEGEPKAVVQFVHGMAEHIDRYDAPARALAAAGFAVTGHNHLGHGPKGIIKGYKNLNQFAVPDERVTILSRKLLDCEQANIRQMQGFL